MPPRVIPEAFQGLPGTPFGINTVRGHLLSLILLPIWAPFWLPFEVQFVSFFKQIYGGAPGVAPNGLGPDLGAI